MLFPQNFVQIVQNDAFLENSHARKLGETTVFYAV